MGLQLKACTLKYENISNGSNNSVLHLIKQKLKCNFCLKKEEVKEIVTCA